MVKNLDVVINSNRKTWPYPCINNNPNPTYPTNPTIKPRTNPKRKRHPMTPSFEWLVKFVFYSYIYSLYNYIFFSTVDTVDNFVCKT